jgi:hypothetical protein
MNLSAMCQDYLPGNGKPESHTRSYSHSLIKALKDIRYLFRRYTRTAVNNSDFYSIDGLSSNYLYLTPSQAVLDGIVQQVAEYLFQPIETAAYSG